LRLLIVAIACGGDHGGQASLATTPGPATPESAPVIPDGLLEHPVHEYSVQISPGLLADPDMVAFGGMKPDVFSLLVSWRGRDPKSW
jgi:hypothetical protein